MFPEMYAALQSGVLGRALQNNAFDLSVTNIRDYTSDKHGKTDDYPFGGGAGMVMTPQPIHSAVMARDPNHDFKRIYLSPKGKKLDQSIVKKFSQEEKLLFLCGSYEGVDERVIELDIDEELSIGDYVLTSGDLAAMVVINAVARYIGGVLGSEKSAEEESFSDDLLEYPHYTRPQVFEGLAVPEVLVSGNHQKVDEWRYNKRLELTKERRPDLLKK